DEDDNEYVCQMEDLGIFFDYDLPEDKFRQPYMARRVRITFEAASVPALGYKTYALVQRQGTEDKTSLFNKENEIENKYFNLVIESNGSLTITDKQTNRQYKDLGIYEDTGDVGSEYMYKQPKGEEALTTKDLKAATRVIEDTP